MVEKPQAPAPALEQSEEEEDAAFEDAYEQPLPEERSNLAPGDERGGLADAVETVLEYEDAQPSTSAAKTPFSTAKGREITAQPSTELMDPKLAAAYRAPSLQVSQKVEIALPEPNGSLSKTSGTKNYPLHRAVFDGQIADALDILKSMSPEERIAADPQGNTVLHIAVLRKKASMVIALLDAGIPPNVPNQHRWTPLDEAVSLKDKELVKLLHARETASVKAELKAKKGDLLRSLTMMPDLSFQLKWELGSPVLGMLLRKYAPNDTYEVWKLGTKMRVDGTLMGLDDKRTSLLPQWKRGHFSLLFDGSTTPATMLLCDHAKKKYLDLSKEKKKHKASLDEEAAMIISEGAGRTKMRASEFRFKVTKTWLGHDSTEKIEGWKTKIYEAAGKMIAVTVNKSPMVIPANTTFEQYLALEPKEDEVTEVPIDPYSMDTSPGKPIKQKGEEEHDKKKKAKQARRLTGKCWMAENFPMSLKQLLPLLEVIGNANKHIARVGKFLQKYGDMSLFPVKLQVPLIYTVYALISFRQFKTLGESTNEAAKQDDWYKLPAGYTLKTFDDIAASKRSRRSASWDDSEKMPSDVEGSDAEILAQMGL